MLEAASLFTDGAVLCRDSLMQYDINGYLTGVQTILKEK